ncbi:MAG: outer membrane beta-barrel family protein [Flavobacterium sp.]|nr:outer membrane beta-barrel family protein [Flavobacterium sp.]
MKNNIVGLFFLMFCTISSAQTEIPKDTVPNDLQEIVIEGKTQTFSNKNGNIKINIANSVFENIPNVVDILSKLPKIVVSPDKESLSVVGKGEPLLYMDTQKVTMNDLNSLDVGDIKSIEIINNPSAKYEAEGRAVVLITRKSGRREGFKTSFLETASFKKSFNNYLGFNASLQRKKLEIKTNFNYNQLHPWESNGNEFSIPDQNIESKFLVVDDYKRPQHIAGAGILYKINEDDYLSFNVSNQYRKDLNDIAAKTFYAENGDANNVNTKNFTDANRNFFNSFANYNKKLGNKAQWFTGLQFSDFRQNSESNIYNNYNDSAFHLTQTGNQHFRINVISARTDFEKIFKNEIKLETGLLWISAHTKTDYTQFNYENTVGETANYLQKESNAAAYIQLSGKYKKFDFLSGIRIENTDIKGENVLLNNTEKNNKYTNIFPKLQIDYAVDSTKIISFNYAKSIIRPNYSATGQTLLYANPYFTYAGNPNLSPSITDEISGAFQFGDKSVKLSYYKTVNPEYFTFAYDEAQQLTFKLVNLEKESGYNLEFGLPFKSGFWSCENILFFSLAKVEDPTAVRLKSNPFLYYYSNQTFAFPKQLSASVGGYGITKNNVGAIQRNAYFVMNMAVSKTFNNNISCTLSWNDIFKNANFYEDYNITGIDSKVKYYTDTSEFSIAIKYTFGKVRDFNVSEKTVNENTSRIK